MRCFYVLKKRSSAKLSLNRDLSLNKVSLNRDCTVFSLQIWTRFVRQRCDPTFEKTIVFSSFFKQSKTKTKSTPLFAAAGGPCTPGSKEPSKCPNFSLNVIPNDYCRKFVKQLYENQAWLHRHWTKGKKLKSTKLWLISFKAQKHETINFKIILFMIMYIFFRFLAKRKWSKVNTYA